MKMNKRILLFLGASLLALSLWLPTSSSLPVQAQGRVGARPPSFMLPFAPGGPSSRNFRMADYIGKNPVIILFWATWCVPCRQELPFYETLYKKHRSKGLKIVAISMDAANTISRVGPAARRLGVTFDVVTDLDTRVTSQINPRKAAPFSIWVDRSGRIVWEREGFAPAEMSAISTRVDQLVSR